MKCCECKCHTASDKTVYKIDQRKRGERRENIMKNEYVPWNGKMVEMKSWIERRKGD
ncbi:hypothetical protein KAR91_66890 [Candidatus Pacearchaeota archaeon]|nr:hypothetical protein [Candidatus Pacearchaeota archaeon]